jgi:hypothetical protein
MKESELQQIWRKKRLPFCRIQLATGESFSMLHNGTINSGSGPDFFDAELVIDGIRWRGNVEIHINASDWYIHGHHRDSSYDNVILHVVFNYDREIFIKDRRLPTLELKKYVRNRYNFRRYNIEITHCAILCKKKILEIDQQYLANMKEKAIVQRYNRKSKTAVKDPLNLSQILYNWLGQAFGMKINQQPFQELTYLLPLKLVKGEKEDFLTPLFLLVSGLKEEGKMGPKIEAQYNYLEKKYPTLKMESFLWQKKGLRPAGFPAIRILQFSEVVKKFDFSTEFAYLEAPEILSYLKKILMAQRPFASRSAAISAEQCTSLITNCFAPFIWWFGFYKGEEQLQKKALQLLRILPPEHNAILGEWQKCGVRAKNAYDCQALLEIYNEFCSKIKCLECAIGMKVLGR